MSLSAPGELLFAGYVGLSNNGEQGRGGGDSRRPRLGRLACHANPRFTDAQAAIGRCAL